MGSSTDDSGVVADSGFMHASCKQLGEDDPVRVYTTLTTYTSLTSEGTSHDVILTDERNVLISDETWLPQTHPVFGKVALTFDPREHPESIRFPESVSHKKPEFTYDLINRGTYVMMAAPDRYFQPTHYIHHSIIACLVYHATELPRAVFEKARDEYSDIATPFYARKQEIERLHEADCKILEETTRVARKVINVWAARQRKTIEDRLLQQRQELGQEPALCVFLDKHKLSPGL